MKTINKFGFALFLSLTSITQVFADVSTPRPVPEIDANIAVLGLGLLAGIVSLASEYRRKK